MRKIVINGCYGGFSLSRAVLHRLREMENEAALAETDVGEKWGDSGSKRGPGGSFLREIARDDPQLIVVVEEMGEKADGDLASLRIVEIPDGVEWEIEEYDGIEHIAESHRTWR